MSRAARVQADVSGVVPVVAPDGSPDASPELGAGVRSAPGASHASNAVGSSRYVGRATSQTGDSSPKRAR